MTKKNLLIMALFVSNNLLGMQKTEDQLTVFKAKNLSTCYDIDTSKKKFVKIKAIFKN